MAKFFFVTTKSTTNTVTIDSVSGLLVLLVPLVAPSHYSLKTHIITDSKN
jgi:hypothetical protein